MPPVPVGAARPDPPVGRHRVATARRRPLIGLAFLLICAACTTGTTPNPTGSTHPDSGTVSDTASSPTGGDTGTVVTTSGMGPETDKFVPLRQAVPDSADGKRIGLIGLNQASPFSQLVSKSIEEQLSIAGAEFVYCDSEANAEVALGCARRFATQGVDAYLTFQPVVAAAQSICDAGPQDVPVIAIDTVQGDCEAARMGVNNLWVGYTAGVELGRFAQGLDCEYDTLLVITDSSLGPAAVSRVEGIESGFAAQCPGEPHDLRVIDAPSQDVAFTEVGKLLATMPPPPESAESDGSGTDGSAPPATAGTTPRITDPEPTISDSENPSAETSASDTAETRHHMLVAGVTDAGVLGALAAAEAAGRVEQVDAVGLGAATVAHCEIATNPHWIGDVAFFPEHYGEIAVPYLIDLLDGKQVPAQLFIESIFLDADTISEHYDIDDCRTG